MRRRAYAASWRCSPVPRCWRGCPRAEAARPEGDAIVVALANSPVNLDPRVGADEASQKAHQLLYSTLVRIDANLKVAPELAELELLDPVTYIARLRHGVLFHNGRELTSEDVVYTFRSFLDPAFRGRSGAYRQLASVEAKDRFTVEFKLKEPFGSFPINLVMGIVQAGSGEANARQPIGTGPYRMTSFVQDDRLVLEPFDQYYGERAKTCRGAEGRSRRHDARPRAAQGHGRPGRQRPLTGHRVAAPRRKGGWAWPKRREATTRTSASTSGTPCCSTRASGARSATPWTATRSSSICAAGLRRSQSASCRRCRGRSRRTSSTSSTIPARRAGCSTRPAIRTPTATVRFPASASRSRRRRRRSIACRPAAIQADLARVGIAVDVKSSELQTLFADVLHGSFQMYTLQWVGVTDPDMLRRVYHSRQTPPTGLNRVHYSNPEVDRLIESARVGRRRRRATAVLHARPAADCRRRAVHQPLVQDQRRGVPARHPRRPPVADR